MKLFLRESNIRFVEKNSVTSLIPFPIYLVSSRFRIKLMSVNDTTLPYTSDHTDSGNFLRLPRFPSFRETDDASVDVSRFRETELVH